MIANLYVGEPHYIVLRKLREYELKNFDFLEDLFIEIYKDISPLRPPDDPDIVWTNPIKEDQIYLNELKKKFENKLKILIKENLDLNLKITYVNSTEKVDFVPFSKQVTSLSPIKKIKYFDKIIFLEIDNNFLSWFLELADAENFCYNLKDALSHEEIHYQQHKKLNNEIEKKINSKYISPYDKNGNLYSINSKERALYLSQQIEIDAIARQITEWLLTKTNLTPEQIMEFLSTRKGLRYLGEEYSKEKISPMLNEIIHLRSENYESYNRFLKQVYMFLSKSHLFESIFFPDG
jgi:hypothetical protein